MYSYNEEVNKLSVHEELSKKDEEELLKSAFGEKELIEKEVSLSWDGKNLIVRVPKEISDYLNLNKENRFKKKMKFSIIEKEEGVIKSFEVVDREKPKRRTKKDGTKKG